MGNAEASSRVKGSSVAKKGMPGELRRAFSVSRSCINCTPWGITKMPTIFKKDSVLFVAVKPVWSDLGT
jgi:hypothetical protein